MSNTRRDSITSSSSCLSSYLEKVVKERDALKQQLEAAKQQISSLKSECKVLLAGELVDV